MFCNFLNRRVLSSAPSATLSNWLSSRSGDSQLCAAAFGRQKRHHGHHQSIHDPPPSLLWLIAVPRSIDTLIPVSYVMVIRVPIFFLYISLTVEEERHICKTHPLPSEHVNHFRLQVSALYEATPLAPCLACLSLSSCSCPFVPIPCLSFSPLSASLGGMEGGREAR